MHEVPMIDPAEARGVDDNVVALPDLMNGRLADLLAAAGGPAQEQELGGELAARTAFRSAVQSWPTPRRRPRMRRGPDAVAATTMAALLGASTGLAAASELPGSAGRSVDGLLGSVGVHIGPTSAPAAPAAPGSADVEAVSAPALHPTGSVHVGCTTGGTVSSGVAGTVGTPSCALTAPLPVRSHVVTSSAAPVSPRPTRVIPTKASVHGAGPGTPGTPSTPPTTLPGGGTSRGGNQGVGGGGCKGGSTGSTTTTTTTDPSSASSTSTSTTDATTTGAGCGKGGHHHGASGGQTAPSGSGSDPSTP